MSDDKKWSEKEEIAWRYGIMKGEEQERSRIRGLLENFDKECLPEGEGSLIDKGDYIKLREELLAETDAEKDDGRGSSCGRTVETADKPSQPTVSSETSRCECYCRGRLPTIRGESHHPDCPRFKEVKEESK